MKVSSSAGERVQPVRVPRGDDVDLTGAYGSHERGVLGPGFPAVGAQIVVGEGADHVPAVALSQRGTVLALALHPQALTAPVVGDAGVDSGSRGVSQRGSP